MARLLLPVLGGITSLRCQATQGFDFRELTPDRSDGGVDATAFIRAHVNPYGRFDLDIETRVPLD